MQTASMMLLFLVVPAMAFLPELPPAVLHKKITPAKMVRTHTSLETDAAARIRELPPHVEDPEVVPPESPILDLADPTCQNLQAAKGRKPTCKKQKTKEDCEQSYGVTRSGDKKMCDWKKNKKNKFKCTDGEYCKEPTVTEANLMILKNHSGMWSEGPTKIMNMFEYSEQDVNCSGEPELRWSVPANDVSMDRCISLRDYTNQVWKHQPLTEGQLAINEQLPFSHLTFSCESLNTGSIEVCTDQYCDECQEMEVIPRDQCAYSFTRFGLKAKWTGC